MCFSCSSSPISLIIVYFESKSSQYISFRARFSSNPQLNVLFASSGFGGLIDSHLMSQVLTRSWYFSSSSVISACFASIRAWSSACSCSRSALLLFERMVVDQLLLVLFQHSFELIEDTLELARGLAHDAFFFLFVFESEFLPESLRLDGGELLGVARVEEQFFNRFIFLFLGRRLFVEAQLFDFICVRSASSRSTASSSSFWKARR